MPAKKKKTVPNTRYFIYAFAFPGKTKLCFCFGLFSSFLGGCYGWSFGHDRKCRLCIWVYFKFDLSKIKYQNILISTTREQLITGVSFFSSPARNAHAGNITSVLFWITGESTSTPVITQPSLMWAYTPVMFIGSPACPSLWTRWWFAFSAISSINIYSEWMHNKR